MWWKMLKFAPKRRAQSKRKGKGRRSAKPDPLDREWAPDAVYLLHVGKTGGTYLKSVIRYNLAPRQNRVVPLRHRHSTQDVFKSGGSQARLAFVFRDPTARFVSGFYSRQRQGRPQYESIWNPGEAMAFSFFRSPDALACALDSDDPTEKSMAIFAMGQIRHFKRNYAQFFGSVEDFDRIAPAVTACLDLPDLDDNLGWFLGRLGLENAKLPQAAPRHANSQTLEGVSEAGEARLRAFWAEEYALYDRMKALAARLREG